MSSLNPMKVFTKRPKPDPYERPFSFERLLKVCFPDDFQSLGDLEKAFTEFDYYRNDVIVNGQTYMIEMEACSDVIHFTMGPYSNNQKFSSELRAELVRLDDFMLDDVRFTHCGGYFEEKEIWGMIHLLELLESEK